MCSASVIGPSLKLHYANALQRDEFLVGRFRSYSRLAAARTRKNPDQKTDQWQDQNKDGPQNLPTRGRARTQNADDRPDVQDEQDEPANSINLNYDALLYRLTNQHDGREMPPTSFPSKCVRNPNARAALQLDQRSGCFDG